MSGAWRKHSWAAPSQTLIPAFQQLGIYSGDRCGWAVAGGSDVNGDGFSDLTIGATVADVGLPDIGCVSVRLGNANGVDPYAIGNYLGNDPPGQFGVGPNPCRDLATICFAQPVAGEVDMTVHDVSRRQIARLLHGQMVAGHTSSPGIRETMTDGACKRECTWVKLSQGATGARARLVVQR